MHYSLIASTYKNIFLPSYFSVFFAACQTVRFRFRTWKLAVYFDFRIFITIFCVRTLCSNTFSSMYVFCRFENRFIFFGVYNPKLSMVWKYIRERKIRMKKIVHNIYCYDFMTVTTKRFFLCAFSSFLFGKE